MHNRGPINAKFSVVAHKYIHTQHTFVMSGASRAIWDKKVIAETSRIKT